MTALRGSHEAQADPSGPTGKKDRQVTAEEARESQRAERGRSEAAELDPDAPGRSLFDDGDAVEPNEPG
jgi:hypothetical protein